ncbi:ATP synthase (E/31 kDa) subunit [Fragilaria crotonensis]|nr:ATP synthase (E/31 kDa) subunit [Fragilaria crotonensis]
MASDQIRQMVNFILQEAHEKANEIRVKTEHDFNLEKQTLVHEAKLNIQEEFTKKEKDREIQERIVRSAEIGGMPCEEDAGLIKIEENEVVIYCRKDDVPLVEKVLPAAIQEYVDIIERESTVKLTPVVTLNPDRTKDLNDSSYGGVMLTAINGKIVCDNTMSSRLSLVYEELLPSIRAILFPEEQ